MALWTYFGLARGRASSGWPRADAQSVGQNDVHGLPELGAQPCAQGCQACVEVCPTDALRSVLDGSDGAVATTRNVTLDYGRCIGCRRCLEVCPTQTLQPGKHWDLATRMREDLLVAPAGPAAALEQGLAERVARRFRHSLHIRHVDAGSCNGCESELQALFNPFYNLHRLGIFFTASPRAADLLLVTGTLTEPMREPLRAAWEAMPEPKWVMATGACAISGGPAREGYAGGSGLGGVVPVDVFVPGCPPTPAAIMQGLLLLLDRSPRHLRGGIYHE